MLQEHSHIDDLLAKRLAGEESTEDKQMLDSLLEDNPSAWLMAEKGWLSANSDWFTEEDAKSFSATPYLQPKQTKQRSFKWVGIAASLTLIAMISFFLIRENEVESFAILSQTKTESGQQKELTLPDGSIVRMNASSTLRFPEHFAADKREVYLEGEAYFEVVSDAKRPLIIHGTEANVKVLGTAFNVNAYPGKGMEVAVRTGKVNMVSHSGNGTDVLMVPMMKKGVSNKAMGLWQVEAASDQDFDWLEGKLIFNETPLGEVVQELSRWYGVEIELTDENLAACRISSTFYRNSIEEVLETLSLIVDLHYEHQGERYVISGKGC